MNKHRFPIGVKSTLLAPLLSALLSTMISAPTLAQQQVANIPFGNNSNLYTAIGSSEEELAVSLEQESYCQEQMDYSLFTIGNHFRDYIYRYAKENPTLKNDVKSLKINKEQLASLVASVSDAKALADTQWVECEVATAYTHSKHDSQEEITKTATPFIQKWLATTAAKHLAATKVIFHKGSGEVFYVQTGQLVNPINQAALVNFEQRLAKRFAISGKAIKNKRFNIADNYQCSYVVDRRNQYGKPQSYIGLTCADQLERYRSRSEATLKALISEHAEAFIGVELEARSEEPVDGSDITL